MILRDLGRRSSRGFFLQHHRESCLPPRRSGWEWSGRLQESRSSGRRFSSGRLSSSKTTSVGGGVMGVEPSFSKKTATIFSLPQLGFHCTRGIRRFRLDRDQARVVRQANHRAADWRRFIRRHLSAGLSAASDDWAEGKQDKPEAN